MIIVAYLLAFVLQNYILNRVKHSPSTIVDTISNEKKRLLPEINDIRVNTT